VSSFEGPANKFFAILSSKKLLTDAAVAGFTLADLGLNQDTAEICIREAIIHLAEPGTPGD